MPEHIDPNYTDTADWLTEKAKRSDRQINDLTRERIAGMWLRPDTFDNDWDSYGDPYPPFAYRLIKQTNKLDWQGRLDGGLSGTVAFTIIPPITSLIEKDFSFVADIGGPGASILARFEVDATTGDVTVNYPVGSAATIWWARAKVDNWTVNNYNLIEWDWIDTSGTPLFLDGNGQAVLPVNSPGIYLWQIGFMNLVLQPGVDTEVAMSIELDSPFPAHFWSPGSGGSIRTGGSPYVAGGGGGAWGLRMNSGSFDFHAGATQAAQGWLVLHDDDVNSTIFNLYANWEEDGSSVQTDVGAFFSLLRIADVPIT